MTSAHDKGAMEGMTKSMANANIQDLDAAQRSREAGWAEPQKFDYNTYNAPRPNKEEREANEENQVQPSWAANAAKYEWLDEYGDVGPRFDLLEQMLFRDEHINRTGVRFDKYV